MQTMEIWTSPFFSKKNVALSCYQENTRATKPEFEGHFLAARVLNGRHYPLQRKILLSFVHSDWLVVAFNMNPDWLKHFPPLLTRPYVLLACHFFLEVFLLSIQHIVLTYDVAVAFQNPSHTILLVRLNEIYLGLISDRGYDPFSVHCDD